MPRPNSPFNVKKTIPNETPTSSVKKGFGANNSISDEVETELDNKEENALKNQTEEVETSTNKSPFFWQEWRINIGESRGDAFSYCVCPRCNPSKPIGATPTLLANMETGNFFCHICGFNGDGKVEPKAYRGTRINLKTPYWADISKEQTASWLNLKFSCGLDFPDIEVKQDITFIKTSLGIEEKNALLFPCRIKPEADIESFIILPFDNEEKFYEPMAMAGTPTLFWGMEEIDLNKVNEIIFVSHPLDRIALMMSGLDNIVCLNPNNNPLAPDGGDWNGLGIFEKQLMEAKKFVMAMPHNEKGIRQSEELARRLGRDRCYQVRWQHIPTITGELPYARQALNENGPEKLQEIIKQAPSFPISGIKELYDVNDKVEQIYEFGYTAGLTLGWPSADEFISFQDGEFTLVMGIPGHGKSTTIDNICIQLSKKHKKICAVYSPQSKPVERHFARFMEKYSQKSIVSGRYEKMNATLKDEAKEWVNKHIKIIMNDDEGQKNNGVDYIISKARSLVLRHGISVLAIDSWLDMDHMRPPHITDVEYTQEQINKLIHFCEMYGIHLLISHHPNKLMPAHDGKYPIITAYMLQGGALWRNAPDNIISVYRNVGQQDEEVTDFYIQKIRNEENGKLGQFSLRFIPEGSHFKDEINQERRIQSIKSGGEMRTQDFVKNNSEKQISNKGNSKGKVIKQHGQGIIGNTKKGASDIGEGPFSGKYEPDKNPEDPFKS